MPFLDDIVKKLNEEWLKGSLKNVSPGKIKTHGIAETIIDVRDIPLEGDEEKTIRKTFRYPAVIDNDGEAVMVEVDDQYHLIAYHRLESISNSLQKQGYGDDPGNLIEVANMALIVFAFRDKVRKTSNWLEALIKDTIPSIITLKDTDGKFMQRSSFKIGNSSFDTVALRQREFAEVELGFTNLVVFETKYRIESSWKKGCFNNKCGC
jgi:hypothetical protein